MASFMICVLPTRDQFRRKSDATKMNIILLETASTRLREMPYDDMRSWIAKLDEENQLARITKEVDWKYEIGAITRRSWDAYGESCPALLFENIKDFKPPNSTKLFVGSMQSYSRLALMMDLPALGNYPSTLVSEFRSRIRKPIKPKLVSSGPCKENKLFDNDVNINMFPMPLWNLRDGGKYLGTMHAVIVKDPDSGWVNVGCYRMMARTENLANLSMTPGQQHIGYIYSKYVQRDEPMPVAVIVGMDPVVMFVAGAQYPAGLDEWDAAGAMRGKPIELVKCETLDLEVPATAEAVFEGTVDPRERAIEGPFGEYSGYYGSLPAPKPVFRINCMTYRNDPIWQGTCEGYPVVEDHMMSSVLHAAHFTDLFEQHAVAGIRDVACPLGAVGYGEVIVSIKPMYEGHEDKVAAVIWSSPIAIFCAKLVIVVDEDINPWDYEQVHWSLYTRTDWGEDCKTWKEGEGGMYDPRTEPGPKKRFWNKTLIKSTRPYQWAPRAIWGTEGIEKGVPLKYPPIVRPSPDMMQKVNAQWDSYGIAPVKVHVGRNVGPFFHFWNDDVIEKIKNLKMAP